MVQNAIVQDPNLLRGDHRLIDISLARHDYADTVKWLKKAESLGVTFGDLNTLLPRSPGSSSRRNTRTG